MTPLPQSLKSSRVIGEICDYCDTSFGGEKDLLKKKELPVINIQDIQALPDSLQMTIKLLPFEKSVYVLVKNPFFGNTKKVLSNLKDYYVY